MIRVSPVLRIGVGLAFLTASLLLVGDLIGLFQDPSGALLDARKKVCESLAVQLSVATTTGEMDLVGTTLQAFVERNEDVLSAALRKTDGTVVAEAGEHAKHWVELTDQGSTPTHVKVPIFQADQRWGAMELSLTPHKASGLWGFLRESVYGLAIFVALTGVLGYVFVLRRAMRELNPEAVIPERVKAALDTLTEGVLILDEKEHIVLANKTFADKAGRSTSSLIGVKASQLRWRGPESEAELEDLPWIKALGEGTSQKGIPLSLRASEEVMLSFSVNGALIRDDKGRKRGVLVTFDDITELERRNAELRESVTSSPFR